MTASDRMSATLKAALASSTSGSIALNVMLNAGLDASARSVLVAALSKLADATANMKVMPALGIIRIVVPRTIAADIAGLNGVEWVDVDTHAPLSELLD